MRGDVWAELIDSHYSKSWGDYVASTRFEAGPIDDLPPEFRVSKYQVDGEMHAYATRCMSQPGDVSPLELHLFVPVSTVLGTLFFVELMTAIAHFHRMESRLWLGHTVNFGLLEGVALSCTHGLLSLPYLDGPSLEWMDSPRVRFLWLIPITKEEVEYKKLFGLDALENRFEEVGFNYLDLSRDSVV